MTIKLQTNDMFWWTIIATMVELFDKDVVSAVEMTADLKQRLRHSDNKLVLELIYHDEPFYVAQDLVQIDASETEAYWQRYLGIADAVAETCSELCRQYDAPFIKFDPDRPTTDLSRTAKIIIHSLNKK